MLPMAGGLGEADRHVMDQTAAPHGGIVAPSSSHQLLVVEAAGHRCGLPTAAVVEIHPAVQLVPLPDAPDVVAGLVNRRGQALPVLDLRRRLGLPTRPTELDDRLVVLRLPDRDVALQVDTAVDVLAVDAAALDEAVAATAEATRTHGVAVLADGLLVVLDLSTFLTPTEVLQLEDALEQAGKAAVG